MKNTFYVIALNRELCGIISIVTSVMNHTIYAIRNNFIPIVDLKHHNNMYFRHNRKYRDNVWEYFFKQPSNYSLKDIEKYSDFNVIISNDSHDTNSGFDLYVSDIPVDLNSNNERVLKIKKYYQKYFRFSDELCTYVDNKYEQLLHKNKLKKENILGVLLRGTDYSERKSPGEHIQPSQKKIFTHIQNVINKNPQIKKIYLATEDLKIYSAFKEKFGEMLLENTQYMYNQTYDEKKLLIGEIKTGILDHHYHLAFDYISSLYILSKLDFFIAGRCNGSLLVWLLSKGFKYFYIYNLGTYKKYSLSESIFSVKRSSDGQHLTLSILGIRVKLKKNQSR